MNSQIMLDSGAFTAWSKGKVIDIDKYAEFVLAHKDLFDFCINLDVIFQGSMLGTNRADSAKGSYYNWKRLWDDGLPVLPVFHMGTDVKWLKKYLAQTDYICVGAVAGSSPLQRRLGLDNLWHNYLTDASGMANVKVHALGLTAIGPMLKYPWFSVDSATPIIAAAFGRIFLPALHMVGAKVDMRYYQGTFVSVSDQGKNMVGTATTFLGLPVTIRNKYMTFFEENGYTLGTIENQRKRDTRKSKRVIKENTQALLFIPHGPDDDGSIPTLANSWEKRYQWNVHMWNQVNKRMPIWPRIYEKDLDIKKLDESIKPGVKTLIYLGVSTATHVRMLSAVAEKPDILISFAYMNDNVLAEVQNYNNQ